MLKKPMCLPACLQAVFQKPGVELCLDEILLHLLGCENTSGVRLTLCPEAFRFLSHLNTCQNSAMLLQDPVSHLEGRWSCPAWKDIPV